MTSPAPLVSVLIPCHDLGAWLDEAVDSALAQTLDDLEIVVVDDGSQDPATCRLLADYQRPRTRVLRTPRRGLAAARNLALREARGRYAVALDADDRLRPRFLEKTVGLLERDPGLCFVSTWIQVFGSEQWQWTPERCDLATLLAECTVMTAAPVRRQAVLAVGGYDEGMPRMGFEDWDLWLRLVAAGERGLILPELLFEYRRRPGSMSASCDWGEPHLELTRYMLRKHAELYRRQPLEVLLWREREIGRLLRENDRVERHITGWLEPQIALRREELERLDAVERRGQRQAAAVATGDSAGSASSATEAELGRLKQDLESVRRSWSWRLTRPLRWLGERLLGSPPGL